MAAFTFTTTPVVRDFGRSGYNKDDSDEKPKGNKGRSGYNKNDGEEQPPKPEEGGRSGYN
jgi:hypothetical protein